MRMQRNLGMGLLFVACMSVVIGCDGGEVEGDTTWTGTEVTEVEDASRDVESADPGTLAALEGEPAAIVPLPPNWLAVSLGAPSNGVRVYRQGSEYVTILDMRKGTTKLLTGAVTTPPNDPTRKLVQRKKTTDFWSDAVAQNTASAKVKVVVGGTFGAWSQPTGIAFGLKRAGSLISYGYAAPGGPQPEYPGKVKLITFNNAMKRAWIGPYNLDSFSTSPDLMGALEVDANKSPNTNTGRTFFGVRDDDGDGNLETVLVFTSPSSTQAHASSVLSAFGAQQKAMVDGSGSTFLMIDGVTKIASSDGRLIAQATAFYASP